MRPSTYFALFITLLLVLQSILYVDHGVQSKARTAARHEMNGLVLQLGLTDICLATDARYIRHLSVTDPAAPYMDHPGSVEHFPTGAFWRPEY